MPHLDVAGQQHGLHRVGQVEQAQQIAGGAAAAADGLGGLLVCQTKFADQALQSLGLFQRIEVFALHVFDQRHGGCGMVVHCAYQHGRRLQAGQVCSSEPPFAGNDLVFPGVGAIRQLAHEDRLHDALRLDAFGQFVQCAFVHACAGLVHARHHLRQRQFRRCGIQRCVAARLCGARTQQGFQPASEAFFLGCHTRDSLSDNGHVDVFASPVCMCCGTGNGRWPVPAVPARATYRVYRRGSGEDPRASGRSVEAVRAGAAKACCKRSTSRKHETTHTGHSGQSVFTRSTISCANSTNALLPRAEGSNTTPGSE